MENHQWLITFIENIDRQILFVINGAHNEFLDTIMWWISHDLFGIPFFLFFLYLVYRTFGLKFLGFFLVGLIATVALSDLSAKFLFKEIFERYRPSHNLEIYTKLHFVNDYKGGTYGFVSSHAANVFAITTLTFLILKKHYSHWLLLIFLLPIIVSYSRVYLGVHYPSDVFCGGLLGIALAYLINVSFKGINEMQKSSKL